MARVPPNERCASTCQGSLALGKIDVIFIKAGAGASARDSALDLEALFRCKLTSSLAIFYQRDPKA